jgi:hypothetical protein
MPFCSGSSNANPKRSASASQPASLAKLAALCLQPCKTTIKGAAGPWFAGIWLNIPQIAWVGAKPNFLAELARISGAECGDRKQYCADDATETAK